MPPIRFLAIAALILGAGFLAPRARAENLLDIDPAPESRPGEAWAEIGRMIMEYYDVPNTGPGEMICSLAFFLTGAEDCLRPETESEFQSLARIVKGYSQHAHETFTEIPVALRWQEAKTISPEILAHEIAFLGPVLAEIELPLNEGEAKARKIAILIVGTDGENEGLKLIFNDPHAYPNASNPYVEFGGQVLDESGQYAMNYADFKGFLNWSATLFAIKPD